ncbi:gluconate 2-dehydrogenase subunit 3 family protein [Neisseria sp. Ec49-e6-T10]|uniref:gluconate 2-dehydrogenase subunit 3 family protein n=1 Tax=Neisseria sp. Ec49-e6-T10 TaxID=3140744 RepID=UPI003EC08787
MTKYNRSRRDFLSKSVKIIPSVAIATSSIGHITQTLAQNSQTQENTLKQYTPQYFTQEEWDFLIAACNQLIPNDETSAGAIEACVPEFIDKQMNTSYGNGGLWYMQGPFHPDAPPELGYQLKLTPKEIYRVGIEDTNTYCQQHFNKYFAQLDGDQQINILKQLENGSIELKRIPAKTFFNFLLTNTKEGYFADPQYGGNRHMVGWKMIGFPGARADYMDWVKQHNKHYPFGPVSIQGKRSIK